MKRTTGLHPFDVERLQRQLQELITAEKILIVVKHDVQLIAKSDWVVDFGPGADYECGKTVDSGRTTAGLRLFCFLGWAALVHRKPRERLDLMCKTSLGFDIVNGE